MNGGLIDGIGRRAYCFAIELFTYGPPVHLPTLGKPTRHLPKKPHKRVMSIAHVI